MRATGYFFIWFFLFLCTPVISIGAMDSIDDYLPDVFVEHDYGLVDDHYFQAPETWEEQTDVNLSSVTTTSGDSSGTTLNVVDTSAFTGCLDTSQILVDGQTLTIEEVVDSTTLTVSAISGTIATGQAVACGFVLTCYSISSVKATNFNMGGATTNSDYFRVLRAADGEQGSPTAGVRFSRASAVIRVNEDYSVIYGVAATATQIAGYGRGIDINTAHSTIINCVVYDVNNSSYSSSYAIGFLVYSSDTVGVDISLINCVAIDIQSNTADWGGFCVYKTVAGNSTGISMYNCTATDCSENGFFVNTTAAMPITIDVTNCISQGNGSAFGTSSASNVWDQTTCVTSDVSFDTDGYHLASDDTEATGQGTDLSTSFTFDIDSDTRSTPWSIGADTYAVIPDVPDSVDAYKGSTGPVITWATAENADTYNVYRATSSGSQGETPYVSDIDALTYTDTSVDVGNTYYYTVTAENSFSESAESDEVSVYWRAPISLYVTDSGATNGDGSESSPWAGWDNVVWSGIDCGDTIYDTSNEAYALEGIDYAVGNPVIIDGSGSTISSLVEIDNNDWGNVSGNLWRAEITASDLDYRSATTPSSPSVGEKWMFTSSAVSPNCLRAKEYTATGWVPCDFYLRPNFVFIDGESEYPKMTNFTPNTISSTEAEFDDTHTLTNYWTNVEYTGAKPAFVVVKAQDWCYNTLPIKSSTNSGISEETTITFDAIQEPGVTEEGYIYDAIGQLDTEKDWAYDGNQYLYVYSTDPTAYTWQYSDGGTGIFIFECNGLTFQGYTIKYVNNGSFYAYESKVSINNNTLMSNWVNAGYFYYGDLTVAGTDCAPSTGSDGAPNYLDMDGCSVSGNIVRDTKSQSGIYIHCVKNLDITHNQCSNIGDANMLNGGPCGIATMEIDSCLIDANLNNWCAYGEIRSYYIANSTISNNVCNHSMQYFSDGAALYAFVAYNNTFEDNRIENTYDSYASWGFYLDMGLSLDVYPTSLNTVQDNMVYNLGNPYTNKNYNGAFGCHVTYMTADNSLLNNTLYDSEAYPVAKTPTLATGDWSLWQTAGAGPQSGNQTLSPSEYPYLSQSSPNAILFLRRMY